MAIPKSKVKLTLDDDLKEGSLSKAVSNPGRGAGASKPRDMSSGPANLEANGVTTNISAEDEGTLSKVGTGAAVVDPKSTGVVGSESNPIPEGFFLINGQLISHADFISQQSQGTGIQESAIAEGTLNNPDTPFSTAGTFSGTAPSGGTLEVPGSAPVPTIEDALANFDYSQFTLDPLLGFQTDIKNNFGNLTSFSPDEIRAGAADRLFAQDSTYGTIPTQPVTSELQALIHRDDFGDIFGVDELQIVEHRTTDPITGATTSDFVFLNPKTGQALRDTEGNPLAAAGGQFLTDEANAVSAAARSLTAAEIARDDDATIAQKQAILEGAIVAQNRREADIFAQQGNRFQAMLQSSLNFASQSALDTASREFQASQAAEQRQFEANLAEFQADNQFAMQALGFEFQSQQRMMELAWLNGSPAEAKAARLQSQDIERRQIALQERELLVSTLAILGQHPQLRGAIKALGLFSGHGAGSGFDFDQFFSGTLPTNAIPSAQEFNTLSPSAQEAMINDLAGKHGISTDIIIQTIRQQAPAGTRRLA